MNPLITNISTKLLLEYKPQPGHETSTIACFKIMHKDLNAIKSKARKQVMMRCFNNIFHTFISCEMAVVNLAYPNAGLQIGEITYNYIIQKHG